MKLKRISTSLLTLLFACIAIYSSGQQGQSFKLYQNTDIFQLQCIRLNPREETKQVKANFSRISLAVVFTSRKRSFHEVELLIPEFSKPIEKLDFPLEYTIYKGESFDQTANAFSFRYEFGKLMGDKSKPIHFLLSTGINPYYVQLEYVPTVPNDFYRLTTYYGFALNATPRLYFKLNRHFSIDVNSPIRIYNFQRATYRHDNPILPVRQQRLMETNHLFLEPVFTFRLGVVWHLSPDS
jgi:hypothetical protein